MSIVGRGKEEAKTEVWKHAAARAGRTKPQVLRRRWATRWDILEAEATRLASEFDPGEEEEGSGKAGFPFEVTNQVPEGLFICMRTGGRGRSSWTVRRSRVLLGTHHL